MNLKDLKNWAREEGIVGHSQMSKSELMGLWEESQPERPRKKGNINPWMNKTARLRMRRKINPLDLENKEINIPILIPAKRKIQKSDVSQVIERNSETVVDWMNWLESVDDVDVRRRVDLKVEELKRRIERLWEEEFVVEEKRSALREFVREFVIR